LRIITIFIRNTIRKQASEHRNLYTIDNDYHLLQACPASVSRAFHRKPKKHQ